MTRRIALALVVLLAGCTATINDQPLVDTRLQSAVAKDFTAARDNFKAVGMTAEAACMDEVLAKIAPAGGGPSLQVAGIFSFASVGYIAYDQFQKQLGQGPNAVSPACQQIVGKVILAIGSKGAQKFGL